VRLEAILDACNATDGACTVEDVFDLAREHRAAQDDLPAFDHDLNATGMRRNSPELGTHTFDDHEIVGFAAAEPVADRSAESASTIGDIAPDFSSSFRRDVTSVSDLVGKDVTTTPSTSRIEEIHGCRAESGGTEQPKGIAIGYGGHLTLLDDD
jgi:hypothetical protein